MSVERFYTTQLGAGLGMISETMALLRMYEPGSSTAEFVSRAVQSGLFSRATARRSRNLVAEMFAPRYLDGDGSVASRLKFLLDHRFPSESLIQIFFLQTARAQLIFRDFLTNVYWPKYSAGAGSLTKEDAAQFIYRALDTGQMKKRWSESMIERVAGYLLGCSVDFGLLSGSGRAERHIKRFTIRPDVALYLTHDIHFSGASDMTLIQNPDWILFGLVAQDVLHLIQTLSREGHMLIQSAADLVQISWKYRTMEECLNALTQG